MLHLIKPVAQKKHVHVLPALQPTSHLTTSTAHKQGVTVQIHRLLGRPGAPSGQGRRRGSKEASVSLWVSGTEPEPGARIGNSAANIEEQREERNPRTGARRDGRGQRRRGLGLWLPLPRPLGAVQSPCGSGDPVVMCTGLWMSPCDVEEFGPLGGGRGRSILSSPHSQRRWPQRGTVSLPAGVPKKTMGR